MMKTAGIVAEYNPFHRGHKFHIEETRRLTGAECIVAVMSGDFVQRGEPALFNKWLRAEEAVKGGADLVLELPTVYACSGAEYFAKGAVRLLDRLGCVGHISFGAEAGSVEELTGAAKVLAQESPELRTAIKENLSKGLSFASARAEALKTVYGDDRLSSLISEPNNILGVEYIKQIIRTGSSIEPVTVLRRGSGYYDDSSEGEENFAGAGRIRELLLDGTSVDDILGFIPEECREIWEREEPAFCEDLFPFVMYKLLSSDPEALSAIDGVTEGLENRAVRAAADAGDFETLADSIKSKRYSRTAVNRMLVRVFLGIKKEDMESFEKCETSYGRVLAFSQKGAALIRRIKKDENSRVKLITNINREWPEEPELQTMLRYDIRAGELYSLMKYSCADRYSDHRMQPFNSSLTR